jgi:hypothetical protein
MRTVADLTKDIVKQSSYLEEALSMGIINFSALARIIKPQIESKNLKKTSSAAIVMALQRLSLNLKKHGLGRAKQFSPKDLTIKSNLVEFVFDWSPHFSELQAMLANELKQKKNIFFNAAQGVSEATVIVSQEIAPTVDKLFKKEKISLKMFNLSSITLRFTENTVHVAGVYYNILKALAWENITITEVVSVGSELSLIFEQSRIEKAFAVIKQLIK